MGVASTQSDSSATGVFEVSGIELDKEDSRKARTLYDYEAEKEDELTVPEGQVYTA